MSRSDRIASLAEGYVAAKKYSGIEWQIEARGETISAGQAGYSDAGAQTPIPDGAIYRIYSMTKPIVSLLALQLIEQGKLRLYDMLPQYDERFASMRVLTPDGAIVPAARPINIEDLLTHRAGFTYEFIHGCQISPYYRDAEIAADGSRTLDEMMEALAAIPLAFQPGSRFRYSVCIDVLAHVCEKAGGKPLDVLLKENILEPLGMIDTDFHVPAGARDRLMPMYGVGELTGPPPLELLPQVLEPMDVDDMYPSGSPGQFARGGHGLFSTLADYTAFARMLLTGKSDSGDVLVSRKMLDMLRANRLPAEQLPLRIGPNVLAGYGWGLIGRVMMDQGQAMTLSGEGEFGWAGAASTFFWVDPVEEVTGVIMTQFLGASLPLSDDMRTAAYQALD